jgi:hypothetical protein
VSHRPTKEERESALEILIDFLLAEQKTRGETINQLHNNHNTMVIILVIFLIALFAVGGALAFFMLLV